MINAISTFNNCVLDIQNMRSIYVYLRDHCNIPESNLADLLRSELVNMVSAMDRFLHEIVRIGINQSFLSTLTATDKCKGMSLRFSTLTEVIRCSSITNPSCQEESSSFWINKEVIELLKKMSFQKISNIKDALSYIWNVEHKIPKIIDKMTYCFSSTSMNDKQSFLETKVDLIAARRNQIVHEADYDLSTSSKQSIDTLWLDDTLYFIKDFVYSIYENISGDTTFNRL